MSSKPKNYSQLFHLLLGEPGSKLSKLLYTFGTIGFTSLFFSQIIAETNSQHYTAYQDTYGLIGLIGMSVGFLCFLFATAIYIGQQNNKYGFHNQLLHLFGKVFLYVLLPGLILSAMFILWAISTNQPAFSQ